MRIETIVTIPEEIIIRPAHQDVINFLIKCDSCGVKISDSNDCIEYENYTTIIVRKEETSCINREQKSKFIEYDFCSDCFDKIAIMFNISPTIREEIW